MSIITPFKEDPKKEYPSDNSKRIENHKAAAKHLEEAAKHHHEAAKHCEAGNVEKASASTVKAHGHSCCAHDLQKEDVKDHAFGKL